MGSERYFNAGLDARPPSKPQKSLISGDFGSEPWSRTKDQSLILVVQDYQAV
jgi:hypothetical protein